MMKNAKAKFSQQTPLSKAEYYYQEIFNGFFTNPTATLTVPIGPQLFFSTPTAFIWSKEFAKIADPSSRPVKYIHKHSAEETKR